MPANPFIAWLDAIASDEIVIDPYQINEEANHNLWGFALNKEQAKALTLLEIEQFAQGVIAARSKWLAEHDHHPMVIYWWHDPQAFQLRFSLVSASHKRLPFGCQTTPAASIKEIAGDWLSVLILNGIAQDSPACCDEGEEIIESKPFVVPVWSVTIP